MASTKSSTIDWGGLDVKVRDIYVGANKPGQAGTLLAGSELTVLDGVTAGTMAASKALVAASDNTILAGGLKLAPVAIADGVAYPATVANSGHLHVVPDVTANITVTLPAAAAGLTYEFIYGGAAADAQNHIFVPTAGFYIGGVTFHDSQADATTAVLSDGNSNDVFTIVTPAAYTVKFVSDGTNWYVTGNVQSATVCTMAD